MEVKMARCEVCGNDYDKAFQVQMDGVSHTFDSFECAIHALAPTCEHCGCRIIGHGVEADGAIFCCANCASMQGEHGLKDRT
jgi:phage terminase large subunit GpA-like protein